MNEELYTRINVTGESEGVVYAPYLPLNAPEERHSVRRELFLRRYEKNHSRCPSCGSGNHNITLVAYIVDPDNPEQYKDLNRCTCMDCGWRGTVHDLVPEKEETADC